MLCRWNNNSLWMVRGSVGVIGNVLIYNTCILELYKHNIGQRLAGNYEIEANKITAVVIIEIKSDIPGLIEGCQPALYVGM